MTNTANLQLPYLAAGQAQKHVTLNESLRILDAMVHLTLQSRALSTPPVSPVEGARYLLPAGSTGAWSGHAGKIALWQDGAWAFITPAIGWTAWLVEESALLAFNGTAWDDVNAPPQSLPKLGINAQADEVNRLAVSSSAALFDHAGSGHRLVINKSAPGANASVVFQTGYSGRVEIGTTGSNNLSIKTSLDGQSWSEVATITPEGWMGIGTTSPQAPLEIRRTSARIVVTNEDPGPSGPGILFYGRDFPTAPNDRLGYLIFGSRGGSNMGYNTVAVSGHAEAGWVPDSSYPTYLRFDTTSSAATGRSERMRLTSNGDLGIGTTAPTTKLHVNGPVRVASYSVVTLPSASTSGAGSIVFVSNEAGGPVLAFSDGTVWRRVTDRAAVA